MKLTYLTLAAAFVATAAFAEDMADTNADGVLSQDELMAAYPEITDETLLAIDADADGGVITVEEHAAALEAGLVKPAG